MEARNLSKKDVKLLTQGTMSHAPDVGETIKQLKNFAKCLAALIRADSVRSINPSGFIASVEDNEESCEANQAMDSLLCLKLLCKVDLVSNRIGTPAGLINFIHVTHTCS